MRFWISIGEDERKTRDKERQRKWRAMNPHKQREYDKKRRELDPNRANKYAKKWRDSHPEAVRAINKRNMLRRRYNLTQIQFDTLLAAQRGCCAVCKSSNPGKRGWHVDHDHKTNRVRGLLCHNCNAALGHAKDDVERLRAMIAYLERENNNGHLVSRRGNVLLR